MEPSVLREWRRKNRNTLTGWTSRNRVGKMVQKRGQPPVWSRRFCWEQQGFGVAAYMAWLGHSVEGASVATGILAALATAFIHFGHFDQPKRAEKTTEIERTENRD